MKEEEPPKETCEEVAWKPDKAEKGWVKKVASWWESNHQGKQRAWKKESWEKDSGDKWADVVESSATALVDNLAMKEEPEDEQMWFGHDARSEEQKQKDGAAGAADSVVLVAPLPEQPPQSESEEEESGSEDNEPGINFPDGKKKLEDVERDFKQYRDENPIELDEPEDDVCHLLQDGESEVMGSSGKRVRFVPALIRLAIPEEGSKANDDLELLESLQPERPRVELKDIPHDIINEQGEKCLNREWVRERVRLHMEDEQARHVVH